MPAARWPRPHRSLKTRYALRLSLVIGALLAAYFVVEARLDRQHILQDRLAILGSMTDLLSSAILLEGNEGCPGVQALLETFRRQHPEFDVLVLDPEARVVAATEVDRIGRVWEEPSIRKVISGRADRSWGVSVHADIPVLDITHAIWGAPRQAGLPYAIHLAEPQTTLAKEVQSAVLRDTVFVVLLLLLLTGTVYFVTHQLVLRPLSRITGDLDRSGWMDDLDPPERPVDEVESLRTALETMMARIHRVTGELRAALEDRNACLHRIEGFNEELAAQVEATRTELGVAQEALIEKERLSAIGELAAGLAHEVRNPLQILRGTVQALQAGRLDLRPACDDLLEEVDRMEILIRKLLDYARPLSIHSESLRLGDLVQRAVASLDPGRPTSAIRLVRGADLEILGDAILLRSVLVNLLENALHAIRNTGGRVEIAGWSDDGESVVEVSDDGRGIAPEDLPLVCQPFFSRKEAGIGMGLALAQRIVELHQGRLEVASELGRGTGIRIHLPESGRS
ncbi:MAG: hypothetical protein JXB39_12230 [Deltaproteobacteria bacterium]|nr:hypothetical protein [Deltaproteobacteria bacterium]